LRDEGNVPMVLVSHSVPEIARLATFIVVLSDGSVTASGPAADVLRHPKLFPHAGLVEAGALVETRVYRHDESYGLTLLQAAVGILTVSRLDLSVGTPVRVRLRARDIILSLEPPEGISALNVLPGVVVALEEAEG